MSFKVVFVFAQALLIQNIAAQSIGAPWAAGPCAAPLAAPCAAPLAAPCAGPWGGPYAEWAYAPAAALAASNGPGLAVTSASPLIPSGVSVISENAYEGALAAGGAVPFLGTVAIEGALPTAGAGATAYGCGNGAVAITAEDVGAVGFAGIAGPLGYATGIAGPIGFGPGPYGIAGPGCGCGGVY